MAPRPPQPPPRPSATASSPPRWRAASTSCWPTAPASPSLGNRDFVLRTGLSKSTVARLTHTLAVLGYLRHDVALGKYRLGAAVLAPAYPLLGGMPIRQLARPLMQAMADEVGGAVSLGVRDRTQMIYVETALATPRPRGHPRCGRRHADAGHRHRQGVAVPGAGRGQRARAEPPAAGRPRGVPPRARRRWPRRARIWRAMATAPAGTNGDRMYSALRCRSARAWIPAGSCIHCGRWRRRGLPCGRKGHRSTPAGPGRTSLRCAWGCADAAAIPSQKHSQKPAAARAFP